MSSVKTPAAGRKPNPGPAAAKARSAAVQAIVSDALALADRAEAAARGPGLDAYARTQLRGLAWAAGWAATALDCELRPVAAGEAGEVSGGDGSPAAACSESGRAAAGRFGAAGFRYYGGERPRWCACVVAGTEPEVDP